jgi:cupin 2 domain-containing protein
MFPCELDSDSWRINDYPMSEPHRIRPLFEGPPATPGTERFDVLFERHGVVIERITSSGSQPPQTFCQSQDEWILLLRGHAEMRIDGELITLHEGESLRLFANTPHEVITTSEQALWLAVHVL